MTDEHFRKFSASALSLTIAWWGLTACQSDCETTRSCTQKDGQGGMGGDLGEEGPTEGDGDSPNPGGDGDASNGDGGAPDPGGDGDASSGDGDGDEPGGDGDTTAPGCAGSELICAGSCIDPSNDIEFCGASGSCEGEEAGESCDSGWSCEQGRCRPVCNPEKVACDGTCIDPLSDELHCGAANQCEGRPDTGRACTSQQACVQGTCVTWTERETVPMSGEGGPSWLGWLPDGDGNAALLGHRQPIESQAPLFLARPIEKNEWLSAVDPIYLSHAPYWSHRAQATNTSGQRIVVSEEGWVSPPYYGAFVMEFEPDFSGARSTELDVRDASYFTRDVSAGLSESGIALVAWSTNDLPGPRLQARLRESSGVWTSATEVVTLDSESELDEVAVAAQSGTDFIIVWYEMHQASHALQWARYSPGGWFRANSPAAELSATAVDLTLHSNRDGGVYLSWQEGSADPSFRLLRYDAESWVDLSFKHPTLSQATELRSLVLKNGDLVTFTSLQGSLGVHHYSIQKDEWTDWKPPVDQQVADLQVQSDAEGNFFLAYLSETTKSAAGLWAVRYDVGSQTWAEPLVLEPLAAQHTALHVTPNGQAMVAFTLEDEEQPFVRRFH